MTVVLFLISLAQGLGALVFSALVLNWIGVAPYVFVGLLVSASVSMLLLRIELEAYAVSESEQPLHAVGGVLLTAAILGGAWPAIPLILAWGAWRDDSTKSDAA